MSSNNTSFGASASSTNSTQSAPTQPSTQTTSAQPHVAQTTAPATTSSVVAAATTKLGTVQGGPNRKIICRNAGVRVYKTFDEGQEHLWEAYFINLLGQPGRSRSPVFCPYCSADFRRVSKLKSHIHYCHVTRAGMTYGGPVKQTGQPRKEMGRHRMHGF